MLLLNFLSLRKMKRSLSKKIKRKNDRKKFFEKKLKKFKKLKKGHNGWGGDMKKKKKR